MAGKDASKQFWKYHNESILKKYQSRLQVGFLDTKPKAEPKAEPEPRPAAAPAAPAAPAGASPGESGDALEPFGLQIPFADPAWYQGVGHSFMRPPPSPRRGERVLTSGSITRPTSTSRMLRCAPRSGSGSKRTLSRS